MLRLLEIQNFVLIDHLSISFEGGLSVITGETGAGKSIILGALGLLLGQKADQRQVRQGQRKCVVEGSFDVPSLDALEDILDDSDLIEEARSLDTLILRREVSQDGRSRAFLNDTPVQVAALKALAPSLLDIHSQHQNLLLNKADFQLRILDSLSQSAPLLERYRSLHTRYVSLEREVSDLGKALREREQLQDLQQFQYTELQEARLTPGEQELLESEQELLEHATEVKSALYESRGTLEEDEAGVISRLGQALGLLRQAARHLPPCAEAQDRMESAYLELKDLCGELEHMEESVECSPERLEMVSERLSLIYRLEKKHRMDSVEQLLELQEDLRNSVESLEEDALRLEKLSSELPELDKERRQAAGLLTQKRQSCIGALEQRMRESLSFLGMPRAFLKVELEPSPELSLSGGDNVRFLFSANPSVPPQDISHVASGGEISRLMLSLKCLLQDRGHMPTVIFDEIDTGTGGETAARMALMMSRMAQNGTQVICITHLPQIACYGKTHFLVTKTQDEDSSVTTMTELNRSQRLLEIARMLSGEGLSDAALENARSLLEHAGQ